MECIQRRRRNQSGIGCGQPRDCPGPSEAANTCVCAALVAATAGSTLTVAGGSLSTFVWVRSGRTLFMKVSADYAMVLAGAGSRDARIGSATQRAQLTRNEERANEQHRHRSGALVIDAWRATEAKWHHITTIDRTTVGVKEAAGNESTSDRDGTSAGAHFADVRATLRNGGHCHVRVRQHSGPDPEVGPPAARRCTLRVSAKFVESRAAQIPGSCAPLGPHG